MLIGLMDGRIESALPTIIRRGIRANLTSCAIRAVRVRDLSARQRTAEDGQSLGGGFIATVRYRAPARDRVFAGHSWWR
jgi:hypothetical protein